MRERWRISTVGEVVSFACGQVDPKNEGIADLVCVGPDNLVSGGGLDQRSLKTARELGMISGKYAFDCNAILYSKIRPNLNKVALPNFDGICSADIYPMWVVEEGRITREFLYYVLTSDRFVASATSRSFRTGLPKINREDLETIEFALPPLPEQRKIAEILRTWDEAIEKLEALRAAKARRLHGLGRTLLERAANDPATVTRPLGDLARIVKGEQLNKLDIAKGEYPVWNGGVTPSGFHDKWNTEGGTITISSGGNSCGFINFEQRRFWLGGDCFALLDIKARQVSRDFLFYALKAREAEIMRLRFGSGIPHIYRADLERLLVPVPSRDVQEKIGRALTAGNTELTLLDAQIEALTRQKRGLMQKLLTGEWRVKVAAE